MFRRSHISEVIRIKLTFVWRLLQGQVMVDEYSKLQNGAAEFGGYILDIEK